MADEPIVPPESSKLDIVHSVAKGAISAAPGVGGIAAEVLSLVIPTTLERRRRDWEQHISDVVNELRERGIDFEDEVLNNDGFATAVIEATKAALGTHLEEKLALLKNAVLHAALPDAPADFLTLRFLRWIDELSPEHFIVLTYARDPAAWFDERAIEKPNIHMGGAMTIMNAAQVPVDGVTLQVVLRDLSDRALANTSGLNATMTGQGAWQAWATDLGKDLADFVAGF